MDRRQALLRELRAQAERCLESEAPTASQARELAAVALAAVAALEGAPASQHPYRSAPERTPEVDALAAVVALERALERTKEQLAAAERALQERKDSGPR